MQKNSVIILKLNNQKPYTEKDIDIDIDREIWREGCKEWRPNEWIPEGIAIGCFEKLSYLFAGNKYRDEIIQLFNEKYYYQYKVDLDRWSAWGNTISSKYLDVIKEEIGFEEFVYNSNYVIATNSEYYDELEKSDLINKDKIEKMWRCE